MSRIAHHRLWTLYSSLSVENMRTPKDDIESILHFKSLNIRIRTIRVLPTEPPRFYNFDTDAFVATYPYGSLYRFEKCIYHTTKGAMTSGTFLNIKHLLLKQDTWKNNWGKSLRPVINWRHYWNQGNTAIENNTLLDHVRRDVILSDVKVVHNSIAGLSRGPLILFFPELIASIAEYQAGQVGFPQAPFPPLDSIIRIETLISSLKLVFTLLTNYSR